MFLFSGPSTRQQRKATESAHGVDIHDSPRPLAHGKIFDARYNIHAFSRDENPLRAVRVEQIQGEAYVAAGYVHNSALDDLGRLDNSNPDYVLDKARGSTASTEVLYLHAAPAEPERDRRDEGGLRVVNITPTASLDDLVAFNVCRESIGPIHRRWLYEAIEKFGPQSVKEITALSLTNDADHTVSYALIREALHRALRGATNEYWIITFAMPAYLKMRKKFGDLAVPQLGRTIYAHRNDDFRTSNDLLLVPTILRTTHFLENIARSSMSADDKLTARQQFNTLRYFAAGLDKDFFTSVTRRALRGEC